ncbi:putative scramblase, tubby-like protein [Helianthus annuus]|nr:putative scramblase, tubby-like protein [Helianthus annuus]
MNWIKKLQGLTRLSKVNTSITTGSLPNNSLLNKQQNDRLLAESLVSERKLLHWRSYGQLYGSGPNLSRKFERAIHTGPDLSRDFLAQLWVADGKIKKTLEKRRQKSVGHAIKHEQVLDMKGLHGSSVTSNGDYDYRQVARESREYTSPEEAWIAPLLSRSNLLITRDIEWANLTLGFEQENRYAIVDVSNPQVPAGFIREQSNVIARQLLRTRRPFVATITDAYGNELFRVRRPFWWITSSIYAEVGGKEIGVVHRRWHLWRRIYDLYLGNEQFAVVENPGFWYWTFTLKDINGEVLAEIDRDWRGFGFEVFTDAGQYVIRFGSAAAATKGISELSKKVQEFEVARPLTLSERAVTVALAISLDNDYFSRHGGWGIPFFAVAE